MTANGLQSEIDYDSFFLILSGTVLNSQSAFDPKEVTLKSYTDIIRQVPIYRRGLSSRRERSGSSFPPGYVTGMLRVILE